MSSKLRPTNNNCPTNNIINKFQQGLSRGVERHNSKQDTKIFGKCKILKDQKNDQRAVSDEGQILKESIRKRKNGKVLQKQTLFKVDIVRN